MLVHDPLRLHCISGLLGVLSCRGWACVCTWRIGSLIPRRYFLSSIFITDLFIIRTSYRLINTSFLVLDFLVSSHSFDRLLYGRDPAGRCLTSGMNGPLNRSLPPASQHQRCFSRSSAQSSFSSTPVRKFDMTTSLPVPFFANHSLLGLRTARNDCPKILPPDDLNNSLPYLVSVFLFLVRSELSISLPNSMSMHCASQPTQFDSVNGLDLLPHPYSPFSRTEFHLEIDMSYLPRWSLHRTCRCHSVGVWGSSLGICLVLGGSPGLLPAERDLHGYFPC